MSRPDRYEQCDDTCTVDCGACKGAPRPAAPAAEADLRTGIGKWLVANLFWGIDYQRGPEAAERLLAEVPELQRLVAEVAEARRLRAVVERVRSMRAVAQANAVTTAALDWALDGEAGLC